MVILLHYKKCLNIKDLLKNFNLLSKQFIMIIKQRLILLMFYLHNYLSFILCKLKKYLLILIINLNLFFIKIYVNEIMLKTI